MTGVKTVQGRFIANLGGKLMNY